MQRLKGAARLSWRQRSIAWAIVIGASAALCLVGATAARADLGTNLQLYNSMDDITPYTPPAFWEDVSGNDHVSLVNTPAYNGGGARTTAVDFVGDNGANRILVKDGSATALDPGLDNYSVSLWFNETTPETGSTYYLSKGNCGNSATGGYAMLSYNGVPTLRMNDVMQSTDTKVSISSAGGAVTSGAWHHLVAVFDRTGTVSGVSDTVQFYVDNVLQGSAVLPVMNYNVSCSDPTYQPLCIGGRNSSAANDFEGYIDDVAIYRGALSAANVNTLYTATNLDATTVTGVTPVAIHNFVTNRGQLQAPAIVPDDYRNNDGVVVNGGAQVTDLTRGKVLQLEDVAGSPIEYVNYGNVLNPGSTSYTVALWCNITQTADAGQRLASKGFAGSANKGWNIYVATPTDGVTPWSVQIRGNYTDDVNLPNDRLNLKKEITPGWHHVALVLDQENGMIKGYLDGVGSGTTGTDNGWLIHWDGTDNLFPTGSNFDSPDNLVLGSMNSSYAANGLLDDFAIWNRALTDTEILSLFNGAAFPPPPSDIPGDADGNQIVNALDAQRLAENWGATSLNPAYDSWWKMGDFNGDHVVNAADASILAANWGATSEAAGVPEPTAAVLLAALACLAAMARGRRD